MLCGTEEEWHVAYQAVAALLQSDAAKFSALEEIYSNQKYYAAWYLRKTEGNLMMAGSVPAKQNHSSICSKLGRGACWSVAKHSKRLMIRQQELTRVQREEASQLYINSDKYKSDF